MNWSSTEIHHFKDHLREARIFSARVILAFFLVICFFAILLARFYSLQVTQYEDYVTRSDENRIQIRPVPPNRGLIFDRDGELLADNRPSFTLALILERIRSLDETLEKLSKIVEIDERDLENFNKLRQRRRRPFEAVPLRYFLNEEEIAKIAVNEYQLQGVKIEAQLIRHYPQGELYAHIIGYVSRISDVELSDFSEQDHERYRGTHSIGKIGLEKSYESVLLGEVGYESVETNAHGRVTRTLDTQAGEDAKPGKNLHLFVDTDIQRAAHEAFDGKRGALVAIEVETGGVMAMVSAPSFDANLFVTGISFKNYKQLNESSDLPLFNRTILGQYPPGSTLKPMLGMLGLESGTVDVETSIYDPGYFQLEGDDRLYRDWKKGGHGKSIDLHKAIVQSCDTYYYQLAHKMGVKLMHPYGKKFGLGERTNIDIPNELNGIWPSDQWKRGARGLPWFPGDNLNMVLGQGDVLTTPLQLAVMTATLARRGKRIQPRIVNVVGENLINLKLEQEAHGSDEHWNHVLKAMEDVAHSQRGTAFSVGRKMKYHMAGKTGTAQVVGIAQDEEYDSEKVAERNRDHALFVGYAPADNPQIAVAAILENGEKSSKAAAVVKQVFDAYMNKYAAREE